MIAPNICTDRSLASFEDFTIVEHLCGDAVMTDVLPHCGFFFKLMGNDLFSHFFHAILTSSQILLINQLLPFHARLPGFHILLINQLLLLYTMIPKQQINKFQESCFSIYFKKFVRSTLLNRPFPPFKIYHSRTSTHPHNSIETRNR